MSTEPKHISSLLSIVYEALTTIGELAQIICMRYMGRVEL